MDALFGRCIYLNTIKPNWFTNVQWTEKWVGIMFTKSQTLNFRYSKIRLITKVTRDSLYCNYHLNVDVQELYIIRHHRNALIFETFCCRFTLINSMVWVEATPKSIYMKAWKTFWVNVLKGFQKNLKWNKRNMRKHKNKNL